MKLKTLLATTVAGVMAAGSVLAGTLDDVRARGKLNCIINTGSISAYLPSKFSSQPD